jgi:hypothetical protein
MMAMPPTAIVATKPSHAARRKQERLENVFLNAVKVVAPFGVSRRERVSDRAPA